MNECHDNKGLAITLQVLKHHSLAPQIINYVVYLENKGDKPIKQISCHIFFPTYLQPVSQSIYVNQGPPLLSDPYKAILLGDLAPYEKLELFFEAIKVGEGRGKEKLLYVEASYKEGRSDGRRIVCSNGLREDRGGGLEGHPRRNGLEICQTGCIKEVEGRIFCVYEIIIRNNGKERIDEIYIYYHLHYKLRLVPETLLVNNIPSKGGIECLKLYWPGGSDKEGNFIKVNFEATVKNEFLKDIWSGKAYCFHSRMRCKYKGQSGKRVTMPTNCIKLKGEERRSYNLRSEPVEVRQKLRLPKTYKPIYAIDHVELVLEQESYTVILHYYSEYGRIFTYMQTESFKQIEIDLRRRIVGEIQSSPVLLEERVLELKIIFWNE